MIEELLHGHFHPLSYSEWMFQEEVESDAEYSLKIRNRVVSFLFIFGNNSKGI